METILRRFDPQFQAHATTAHDADMVANLPEFGKQRFQVKFVDDGAPGALRNWLIHHSSHPRPDVYLVLSAPYLSERAMDVLEAADVGALDLVGNYRLAFGPYRLERVGHPPPPRERRELRNLFAGKTLRVVRALLAAPNRLWGVKDLARACDVSLGTVSGARSRLTREGWLEVRPGGVTLPDPEGLLRQWAEWSKIPADVSVGAYTTLHGQRLTDALAKLDAPHVVLGGTSAAAWMAPFLAAKGTVVYTDPANWRAAARQLEAEEVEQGANLTVRFVEDGVFLDRLEVKPGLWTASPAQTFVDLWRQGGRSREAAEKLLSGYVRLVWAGERPFASWPLRDFGDGA